MARMAAELARSLFHYDADTGLLRWKVRNGTRSAGSIAGTLTKLGYIRVMYGQQSHMAHCIAWTIVHGEWPTTDLDHIDRVRDNNRLSNLRVAGKIKNAWNRRISKVNTSGATGVRLRKQRGKWQASVRMAGNTIYLGHFDSVNAAAEARRVAVQRLHGEFAGE